MSQHSLGYLAVLVAKLGQVILHSHLLRKLFALSAEYETFSQENVDNFGDLLAKCDQFIGAASPEQIRCSLLILYHDPT